MRRTELKNFACGMLSSFNSRNNDVDGYWGIGKLCGGAKNADTSSVAIDLLNAQTTPNTAELREMAIGYRKMLHERIEKASIPAAWIANARREIDFNPEFNPHYHFFRSALAKPYLCMLTIVDDLGKAYSATAGGNCLPHDPSKESRSARSRDGGSTLRRTGSHESPKW